MDGGEIMPQYYLSTDSFNMGERGRVFSFIACDSCVLSRSINVNYYTFYNQGIT